MLHRLVPRDPKDPTLKIPPLWIEVLDRIDRGQPSLLIQVLTNQSVAASQIPDQTESAMHQRVVQQSPCLLLPTLDGLQIDCFFWHVRSLAPFEK